MSKYDDAATFWNDVFRNKDVSVPKSEKSGNEGFDKGLTWLTQDSENILDFGCGNGTVLFLCSFYGSKNFIGIDLSEQAVINAQKRSLNMKSGKYQFISGGIEALRSIESNSIEGAILSNIVDNLYPDDARSLLEEIKRVLIENGKLFVKLNPYITEDEISANKIEVIEDNVLNDGLILWNNTTEQWQELFEKYFSVYNQYDINYQEYDQYNRIFLLINSKKSDIEHKS